MLGIAGYQPDWFDASDELMKHHGDRLASLIGLPLTSHYAVQDRQRGDWFEDGPIALVFGDEQLEIACWKMSEVAVSWGQIDVTESIDWYGTDLDLRWQANWLPPISQALGHRVTGVWITENVHRGLRANGASANDPRNWWLKGVEIGFGSNHLHVFNNDDEIGVEYGPPLDTVWLRRVALRRSVR